MGGGRCYRAKQLALALPHDPAFERADFITGRANEEAVQTLDSWPWPWKALLLTGPEGSGKSHLASAWSRRSGAVRVSVADLRVDRIPALLERENLIIEGADCSLLDEQALFHLLNLIVEQKGNLLVTGRISSVRDWPVALDDLRSRLSALPAVRIGPPDDAMLEAVLFKLFTDRQLPTDRLKSTVNYIIARMERSFKAAIWVVDALDRLSLIHKRPISRSLAVELFKGGCN